MFPPRRIYLSARRKYLCWPSQTIIFQTRRGPGGYVVKDATGQALAYVNAREMKTDADAAKVLTMDEATEAVTDPPAELDPPAVVRLGAVDSSRTAVPSPITVRMGARLRHRDTRARATEPLSRCPVTEAFVGW